MQFASPWYDVKLHLYWNIITSAVYNILGPMALIVALNVGLVFENGPWVFDGLKKTENKLAFSVFTWICSLFKYYRKAEPVSLLERKSNSLSLWLCTCWF